jgi:hypothetical protein
MVNQYHAALQYIISTCNIKTLPEGTNPEMELGGTGGVVQPAPFKIIVEERK